MTYAQMLREGQERLKLAGVEEAEWDAWLLFSFLEDRDRTWYLLHREEMVGQEEERTYFQLIGKRSERIPLQYITGEQEFMGLPFQVSPAVLIPRQDTEVLVEECLRHLKKGSRILDLCTGSGCIAVSLTKYGKEISAAASDISIEALAVARGNADRNHVVIEFLQGDLFEAVRGTFDLIVSNPPYIASAVIETLMPEVRNHEPRIALDGAEDGLFFYRRIIKESPQYLADGGWLCMEIGQDQGAAVAKLMREQAFTEVSVMQDLSGLDRVVSGIYRRNR